MSIKIINSNFETKLYDKRNDFNFEITKFPDLKRSNIPSSPAYGIFISGADKSPMYRLGYWRGYFEGRNFKHIKVTLPCGEKLWYPTAESVPVKDVPCPCGDPNHWLIKYGDGK